MKKNILTVVMAIVFMFSIGGTSVFADGLKQQKSVSCKATAVAEMINRATGSNYKESDFYASNDGSCANINGKKFGNFTVEYKTDNADSTYEKPQAQLDKINDSLSRGVPIVVQVSGSPHHWVVILSKSGNNYWIVDPADGKERNLSPKYTLGAHKNYGYVCLTGSSNTATNNTASSGNSEMYYPSGSYYNKYTGSSASLVDALKAVGANTSFENRSKIYSANFATSTANYSGSSSQNTQMLNMLKNGKLAKYTNVASGSTVSSPSNSTASYFPKYSGSSSSIVDALRSVNVDSSFNYRSRIAAANGITNYSGTASQNTKLLSLLKSGQLRKP